MKSFAALCRTVIAAAAIAMMAACSQESSTVYQVPIGETRQILATTGLPPDVFGSEPPAWDVHDNGSDVTWIVRMNSMEIFRYVAHLKAEGEGSTRVDLEFIGAKSGPAGDVARRLSEHPEITAMYLVAIDERIASALEHRPFEIARVYPSMTAATMANIGALQASADEAAAASAKSDREHIEKAYRDEANGR